MSYTQCPGCLTLFRVDVRHLRQAGGVVRCGLCGESFNALASLCDELPDDLPLEAEDAGGRAAVPKPSPAPSRTTPPPAGNAPEASPEPGFEASPVAGPDWPSATRLEVEAGNGAVRSGHGRALRWLALAALLAAGIAAQALWQQRAALAQDPRWRPWLAEGCELVGCRLPLLERPGAVAVLERKLAAHPGRTGELRFTATVINRAPEPLAWPELGLRLLDGAGRTVAEHWFEAQAYRAGAGDGRGMPAGEPVPLALTVEDPGADAASFEISFR